MCPLSGEASNSVLALRYQSSCQHRAILTGRTFVDVLRHAAASQMQQLLQEHYSDGCNLWCVTGFLVNGAIARIDSAMSGGWLADVGHGCVALYENELHDPVED